MVIATQNPIEMEGTYPLPEAQRDRFMARVSMGYPVESAELAMLNSRSGANPLDNVQPVTNAAEVARLVDVVSGVFVTDAVKQYAVALTTATRRSPDLRLGGSPRATLHLVQAARAAAALDERDYVVPDDILALVVPVLAHRVLPNTEAHLAGRSAEKILRDILSNVPMPQARGSSMSGR
jgi:MoxR-like ATPase